MLDIPSRVRVHVETLLAAQNDMGVCDAIEQYAPVGKPDAMNAPHVPKVAGIDSTVPAPAHTVAPTTPVTGSSSATSSTGPGAVLQDRLAGWVSDLTTLHELTERLVRTATLNDALQELLRAGAALVGARRGLVVMEPGDGLGPDTTIGLGLARADLGHIETVPRSALSYGRILDGLPGGEGEISQPDLLSEDGLDPATARWPPGSATPRATRCPCPPRRRAGWAPPYGSTTNPPNRWSASATSSASTPATRPNTWHGCWNWTAHARA